ncbi:hypothetical protein [Methylobacterium sp. BTF04]|uniref:hypothetical protein n=1 Tax=Methylobacterium sp. BTF04 TaxID=2708300 RepID=UPI001FED2DA9|nr:hypothetical protein [Methylobacterium sp. BTF04]
MTRYSITYRSLGIGLGLAVALHIGTVAAKPITFACEGVEPCVPKAAPGPADRQVHPFEGTLGRPCAYRWRETPSGTRKVRVCY